MNSTDDRGKAEPVTVAIYQLHRFPSSNTRVAAQLATCELRRGVARLEILAWQALSRCAPRGGLSVGQGSSADWSPRAARLRRNAITRGRFPVIHDGRSTIGQEQKAGSRADCPRLVSNGAR